MQIVDTMTCDKCHARYRGYFQMKHTGEVLCADCENPQEVEPITFQELKGESEAELYMLQETMSKMLMEDIDMIYTRNYVTDDFAEEGSYMEQFYNEEGELDIFKLYYHLNPLPLVLEAQKVAYICVRYLESTRDTQRDFAETMIERYKELRLRKLTEEEVTAYWKIINEDSRTQEILDSHQNWTQE